MFAFLLGGYVSTAKLNGNKELSADWKHLHEMQYKVMQAFFFFFFFYYAKPVGMALENCTRWEDKIHTMNPTQIPEGSPVSGRPQRKLPKEHISNQTAWTDMGQYCSQCPVVFGAI